MNFFIACLVIAGMDFSGAWYLIAFLLYVVEILVSVACSKTGTEQALIDLAAKKMGIKGVVDGDQPKG